MRVQITTLAVAVLLAGIASSSWGQRGIVDRTGTGAYEDISKRKTRSTERDERKKRETEQAKKKAEEEKRRAERQKRGESGDKNREQAKGMTTTSSKDAKTTGGKEGAAGRRGSPRQAASATQPATAGGSTDPTTQEVNEVILNSVKTRQVEFNVEAAKKDPKMILLNEPKFKPEERVRAGDTGMAQPL